jgi:hypothetical protein
VHSAAASNNNADASRFAHSLATPNAAHLSNAASQSDRAAAFHRPHFAFADVGRYRPQLGSLDRCTFPQFGEMTRRLKPGRGATKRL